MRRPTELKPLGHDGATFLTTVVVDDQLKRRFKEAAAELRYHSDWSAIDIAEFEYEAPGVAFSHVVLRIQTSGVVTMVAAILNSYFTGMVGTVEGLSS